MDGWVDASDRGERFKARLSEKDEFKLRTICKNFNIRVPRKPSKGELISAIENALEASQNPALLNLDELVQVHRSFEQARKVYSKCAKQLLGTTHLISQSERTQSHRLAISQVRSDLSESFSRIVIIGETSSGKSSFINCLLGRDILPHAQYKVTASICEIKYGTEFKLCQGNKEYHQQSFLSGLLNLTFSGQTTHSETSVLFWPSEILRSGVVLVDTPGLNDTVQNEEQVRQYIHSAIGLIVLVSAETGLTETLERFLKVIGLDKRKMFFVHTKLDRCQKKEERDTVVAQFFADTRKRLDLQLSESNYAAVNLRMVLEGRKIRLVPAEHAGMVQKLAVFFSESLRQKLYFQGFLPLVDSMQFFEKQLKLMRDNCLQGATQKSRQVKLIQQIGKEFQAHLHEATEKIEKLIEEKLQGLDKIFVKYLHEVCEPRLTTYGEEISDRLSGRLNSPKGLDGKEYSTFVQEQFRQKLAEMMQEFAAEQLVKLYQDVREGASSYIRALIKNIGDADLCLEGKSAESTLIAATRPLAADLYLDSSSDSDLYIFGSAVGAGALSYAAGAGVLMFTPVGWSVMAVAGLLIASGMVGGLVGVGFSKITSWNPKDIIKRPREFCEQELQSYLAQQHALELYAGMISEKVAQILKENQANMLLELEQRFDHSRDMAQTVAEIEDGDRQAQECNEALMVVRHVEAEIFNCSWKLLGSLLVSSGNLEVQNEIGVGAYGRVFKGLFSPTNRSEAFPVAIKIIQTLEGDSFKHLYVECESMRNVDHPNVVKCYGIGKLALQHANKYAIIMELMAGTLAEFLDKNPSLSLEERCTILREIAKGMQAMHNKGYLHRDLKLTNVLYCFEGSGRGPIIKIGDFGTAKALEFVHGTLTGSMGYQAPEILLNLPQTAAVDVFSFGLLMWQMLHPHLDLAQQLVRQLHLYRDVDPLRIRQDLEKVITEGERPHITASIGENIRALMQECWAQCPEDRPNWGDVILRLSPDYAPRSDCTRKMRILCLDGGGTRGILMAQILSHLEKRTAMKIHEMFDLVCGTSTGGILALALTVAKKPAAECVDLYKELAKEVFSPRGLTHVIKDQTLYNAEALTKILTEEMQDAQLDGNQQKAFVVTKKGPGPYLLRSYDHHYPHLCAAGESGWKAVDAARATSAAPFYLPPFKKDEILFYDGGVGNNNPTDLALDEAMALTGRLLKDSVGLVLSLGCGTTMETPKQVARSYSPYGLLTGYLDRSVTAVRLFVEETTSSFKTHQSIEKASRREGFPYFRFDPLMDKGISLDTSDPVELQNLVNLADEFISQEPQVKAFDYLVHLLLADKHNAPEGEKEKEREKGV